MWKQQNKSLQVLFKVSLMRRCMIIIECRPSRWTVWDGNLSWGNVVLEEVVLQTDFSWSSCNSGPSCETTLRSGTKVDLVWFGHVSNRSHRNLTLCILFASPPVESHICCFGVANSVESVLGAYRCFKHGDVESFGHQQSLQDAQPSMSSLMMNPSNYVMI